MGSVLATVAPRSWRDTLIRTVKTAVASGVAAILASSILNVRDWKAAATVGLTTGATFLLNAILAWANTP